jgi:Na+-transporting NADH:ubiquinone oxidoreductase subunit C
MKNKILFLLFLSLVWSCKDKPNNLTEKEVPVAASGTNKVLIANPSFQELLEFADVADTDFTVATEKVVYKMVDIHGNSSPLDLEKGVALFTSFPKTVKEQNLPIMEIKGTKRVILMAKGLGFGGPIWAMLLVDIGTLEILKIKFGHKAESEGYGAGIVRTAFQKQFIGKVLNVNANTFWLQQHEKETIAGMYPIDGISGATVTNVAVVNMLNKGLQGYANYLAQG